jgi:tetratricopeptide (TPR) repeat protein
MKPRRLDVMLSSTSRDLPEHRARAEDAANRAGFYVVKMENLTALPQGNDAISVSMEMVEEAEVYLGIFGLRYGYRPNDPRNPNDISITEMEYRRAKELGMPILVFIMHDEHPAPDTTGMNAKKAKEITDAFYERDPRGEEKLDLLKREMMSNHIVAFFESPEDLGTKVLQSLSTPSVREAAGEYAKKREAEQAAGQRQAAAPKATIPFPPTLYAYPPYSGQNALFVGRRDELEMLTKWAKVESQQPMLVLEAIGGMGKSAVTWKWVQDNAVPFDGVFWYSFYEGGAEMGDCVRHALAYVTRRDPNDLQNQSFAANLANLTHALQQERFLIVLDGLERVLVAYHRWNAAQMQDDEVQEGIDYRACTDPRDDDVLRRLAACAPSRILVTTRLLPTALKDGGDLLKGVQHEELRGLSRTDARHLWQERGITWGDEGVLDNFINQFGRHSLLLKLLAGVIKENRRAQGNFDKWNTMYGESFDVFNDVKAKRHHILQFAYEGLSAEARKLLSQMAALGTAIDIDTLHIFNPFLNWPEEVPKPRRPPSRRSLLRPPNVGESYGDYEQRIEREKVEDTIRYAEAQAKYEASLQAKATYERIGFKYAIARFDALLQDLEERGLIWWDKDNLQYDLHPVVRGYAFSRLDNIQRSQTFDHIYDFFNRQEHDNTPKRFTSYKAMQNIIAVYHALIGVGKFNSAARLFINVISNNLVYGGLGLYHKAYELLLPLFPNGLNELPIVNSTHLQGLILNRMGSVLHYLDRDMEALVFREKSARLNLTKGDTSNLTISLGNYSQSLTHMNRLAQALRSNQFQMEIAKLIDNQKRVTYTHYYSLQKYSIMGYWQDAKVAYETFCKNYSEQPEQRFLISAHRLFAGCLYRQGENHHQIDNVLRIAEKLNENENNTLECRLLNTQRGYLELREGEIDKAINHFAEAARIGNEQGIRDASAWGGLSQAYAAQGNLPEALRIIRDGVNDHGYSAAVVYLANQDYEAASEAALELYHWAWAQGEPYVHRYPLQQAQLLLKRLGVPEPQLPVWDESKYEPFEHEEEIRALIEKLKREKGKKSDVDET